MGFGNPTFSASRADDAHGTVIELRAPADPPEPLVPLPETERLLDRLATILGADPECGVVVREASRRRRVLELSQTGELARRRIICFATHAVYPTADGDMALGACSCLTGPST